MMQARVSYADYNGYRYYFYVITANYGFDISSAWPEYSKFPNNNRYLSGWWMMANAGLYGSPGDKNDTVKGVVSTMDEKILGYTDSPMGKTSLLPATEHQIQITGHIIFTLKLLMVWTILRQR